MFNEFCYRIRAYLDIFLMRWADMFDVWGGDDDDE